MSCAAIGDTSLGGDIFRVVAVLLLIAVAIGAGTAVYNAGVAAGLAEAAQQAAAAGDANRGKRSEKSNIPNSRWSYHARMGFWINTISKEHVRIGMKGGFTQANHGRSTTLKRLKKGDLIAFYSPRTSYPDGEALQEFTAMARVTDQEPYQAEMTPDFHPWRRDVEPLETTGTPIRPLLDRLEFIPDKRRWGLPFRRGLFEVSEADFRVIGDAMGAAIGGRSTAR